MALETLDDIVEELANACGIYGGGTRDEHGDSHHSDACRCRMYWVMSLKQRLRAAFAIEQVLERGSLRR